MVPNMNVAAAVAQGRSRSAMTPTTTQPRARDHQYRAGVRSLTRTDSLVGVVDLEWVTDPVFPIVSGLKHDRARTWTGEAYPPM